MAEDLIARYQLDISDLKLQVAELQKQYKTLSDAEKKAGKDGEDAAKKTAKATEDAGKSTKLFSEQIESLGKQLVAAFAVERVIAFGLESVKAFADAEAQAKKLQTAVSVSGGLNKDFENLIAQSSRLQAITIFSDDDIQAAQTAALQYGFTAQQVEKLIPTLIDLASATGEDLGTALNKVITATEGSERALRGQGVVVDANIPKAENFNRIIEQLNKNFEGQGVIIGETAAGGLKKYENQVGELQESIGEKLLPVLESLKLGILSFTNDLLNAFDPDTYKRKSITQQLIDDEQLFNSIRNKYTDEQLRKNIESNKQQEIQQGKRMALLSKESDEYIQLSESNQRLRNFAKLYSDELLNRSKQNVASIKLETLSIEELKKKRDELKNKSDFNSRSELETIEKELKKREEAEKKKSEEAKKSADERKKAIEELLKFTADANQKELLQSAQTEAEKLRIQRDGELKRAQELFKAAGGAQSTEAVTAFNEAKLAIETRYDELIKEAKLKSISDTFSEQQKLNDENSKQDLENTIQNIDAGANQQILALKEAYLAKGDFSKEAEKKLQSDITAIQNDAERKRVEEAYKFEKQKIENAKQLAIQEAFQKSVTTSGLVGFQLLQNKKLYSDINKIQTESNEKNIANENKFAAELAKIGLKIVDGQIVAANEETGNFISKNEEKIRAAQQTASAIIDVFNSVVEGQITAKQNELNALNESYNQEEQQLKESYDRRLIGAGDFEKEQNRIKQQRIQSEKKIQDEIKKLQRQEDIANRLRAVFEITINTAIGISRLIGKTGAAFLIPAAALLGAAQIAAVLATPLPKYAKGTKYLKRDGNPIGEDTIPIMANEGERIIPTKQNLKYWKIYEALDENKWNQFVHRNYIAPALRNQLNEYKKQESNSFAENVSRSLIFNHDLLATKIGAEIEWRNRNGIKIKGMDDLLSALTKQQDIRKR